MSLRQAVYWDANAFLALINNDKTAEEMEGCNAVWNAGVGGQLFLVTSTLTNAEVIYMKGTPKLDPAKRTLVSNFFRQEFIIQHPLTRKISELARDVDWDTSVKPKDAAHVATAAFYKVRIFHTFDGPLLKLGSVNVEGFTVECRKPIWQRQKEIDYGQS